MRQTRTSTHRANRRSKVVAKLPGRSVNYETKNCPHCDRSVRRSRVPCSQKEHNKNNVVRHYAEDNKENHTRLILNVAAKKFRNSQELIDKIYPASKLHRSSAGQNKRNPPSERRRAGKKNDKTGENKIKSWMMQTFPKLFKTPLRKCRYELRKDSKFSSHSGSSGEGFKGFDNVWYPKKNILLGFLIHDMESELTAK